MQINQQKTVQVDVTEMRLHIKVCDRFEADLKNAQGADVGGYTGYVPDFFPGAHFGDYLMLKHSAPIAGMDVESFERPLRLIISTADRLESERRPAPEPVPLLGVVPPPREPDPAPPAA